MELDDDVRTGGAIGGGVNDEDVGDLLQDRGSQRLPPSGWNEIVLRAQDDCQVRKERAGKIGDDVHGWPEGMS